jgi:hypothetical protein
MCWNIGTIAIFGKKMEQNFYKPGDTKGLEDFF